MMAMAEELGGALSIRRSRTGGICLRLGIPLTVLRRQRAGGQPPAEAGGDA